MYIEHALSDKVFIYWIIIKDFDTFKYWLSEFLI